VAIVVQLCGNAGCPQHTGTRLPKYFTVKVESNQSITKLMDFLRLPPICQNMTSLTFQVICQFQKVLSNRRDSLTIPGAVSALLLGSGLSCKAKVVELRSMAVYLARSCPGCRNYFGFAPSVDTKSMLFPGYGSIGRR
jgi:hypothetical protein